MAGAQILFHPNAGLDSLSVSKKKRNGNDGISIRAFENAIYYVFANSVGPQGGGKWSAGDSKIVAPDMRVLAQADNESESLIVGSIDLDTATRKYGKESMEYPRFLAPTWKQLVERVKRVASKSIDGFDLP
jgi:predicted amidohydrolase